MNFDNLFENYLITLNYYFESIYHLRLGAMDTSREESIDFEGYRTQKYERRFNERELFTIFYQKADLKSRINLSLT